MKSYNYKSSLSIESCAKITKSSRDLVQDLEDALAALNKKIIAAGSPVVWASNGNDKGSYLAASFKFKNETQAIDAILLLADLQESSDHHTHFVLENFNELKIELCTHQPQWGVSYMDLAFAEVLTECLKN